MKTAIFIDGANLFCTTKAIGLKLDFRRVLEWAGPDLFRAYYYTALPDTDETIPLRPLVDWLGYNGFITVTKPTKEYRDDVTGGVRVKGNMDIEIAVDMLNIAKHVEEVILFSGDGDFRYLVQAVQNMGVKVTVVGAVKSGALSDDLRRQADEFVDLETVREYLEERGTVRSVRSVK